MLLLEGVQCVSPKLDRHVFTYTDADSLHVHKRDVHHFKDLIGVELGQFDDDYSTGKIVEEICLAPKVYANKILFTTKPKKLDKDIYNEYWSNHNDNFTFWATTFLNQMTSTKNSMILKFYQIFCILFSFSFRSTLLNASTLAIDSGLKVGLH